MFLYVYLVKLISIKYWNKIGKIKKTLNKTFLGTFYEFPCKFLMWVLYQKDLLFNFFYLHFVFNLHLKFE